MDSYNVIKKLTARKKFSKPQAEVIVDVITDVNDNLATKNDLSREIKLVRKDLQIMEMKLKNEIEILRHDMYKGFFLAVGIILAAIKYL